MVGMGGWSGTPNPGPPEGVRRPGGVEVRGHTSSESLKRPRPGLGDDRGFLPTHRKVDLFSPSL